MNLRYIFNNIVYLQLQVYNDTVNQSVQILTVRKIYKKQLRIYSYN